MAKIKTTNKIKLIVVVLLAMPFLSSCAKKNVGTRATVKTDKTDLNPVVSAQANQQGSAVNADYKIATVSIPSSSGNGYTINVELLSPSGEVLPLTTNHQNGVLDSEGVYTDSQRGLLVYVQARCSLDNCFKYTLIVTTTRNNQPVYQSAAISYENDCKFNTVAASYSAGSFIQSLNDADYKFNQTNVPPKNDIDSCAN